MELDKVQDLPVFLAVVVIVSLFTFVVVRYWSDKTCCKEKEEEPDKGEGNIWNFKLNQMVLNYICRVFPNWC